ncbi:Uncharacterised protein [uncultured archaeon]|nr:Uncharacterised protein [uncultured archaeon]
MANATAQRQKIPLNTTLHLNKYNGDIKNFEEFSKNNAPYIGGTLSPLYKKTATPPNDGLIITKDGDEYYTSAGTLYKNGSSVMTVNQYQFTKSKYSIFNNYNTTENKNIVFAKMFSNDVMIFIVFDKSENTLAIYNRDQTASLPGNVLIKTISDVTAFYGASCQGMIGTYAALAISYEAETYSYVRLFVGGMTSGTKGNHLSVSYETYIYSSLYYYEFPYMVLAQIADSGTSSAISDESPTFLISCAKHMGARLTRAIQDTTQEIYNFYARAADSFAIVEATTVSNRVTSFTGTAATVSCLKLMHENYRWSFAPGIFDGDDWRTDGRSTFYASATSANTEYYSANEIRIIVTSGDYIEGDGTSATYQMSYDLYPMYSRCIFQGGISDLSAWQWKSTYYNHITQGVGYQLDTSDSDYKFMYINDGDQCPLYHADQSASRFKLLFNNGYISGICYGDGTVSAYKYAGILLEEWNVIDTDFMPFVIGSDDDGDTSIIYKNSQDGYFYKIDIESTTQNELTYIADRYIFINTTSQKNMYDTKLGKILAYANAYNGWYQNAFSNVTYAIQANISDTYSAYDATVETACVATGINANYELTSDPNFAIQLNPVVLYCCVSIKIPKRYRDNQMNIDDIENGIDYYYSAGSSVTAAEYKYTLRKIANSSYPSIYNNSIFEGAYFPISTSGNILYSPNIFSEYIKSYTMQDFIVDNDTGFPLVYSNLKLIFGYYLLSGINNISEIFIINGQSYAIANGYIIIFSVSDGILSSTQTVCDVSLLTYIAATTSMALFWSPSDYSVYAFTGDRTIGKLYEATKIGSLVNSWYNTGNQNVFIEYDSGLIIITQNNMYELSITDIINIYFTDTDFIIVTSDTVYYYRYAADDDGDYSEENIDLQTEYYGSGSNGLSIIDTWYIRFWNGGTASAGDVTVSVDTITDETKSTDSKKIVIKSSDWDDNGCYYLRFQPKYQRSIGAMLNVNSPFAIVDISCSVSSGGEAQVSHHNI